MPSSLARVRRDKDGKLVWVGLIGLEMTLPFWYCAVMSPTMTQDRLKIVEKNYLGAYEILRKTTAFPSDCWVTLREGRRYMVEVETSEGFSVVWVEAKVLEDAIANEDIRKVVEL